MARGKVEHTRAPIFVLPKQQEGSSTQLCDSKSNKGKERERKKISYSFGHDERRRPASTNSETESMWNQLEPSMANYEQTKVQTSQSSSNGQTLVIPTIASVLKCGWYKANFRL